MEQQYTAIEEAIVIVEILELILSHLPIYNLLRVQAVCHQWRAVIQNSLQLQDLLLLTKQQCEPGNPQIARLHERRRLRLPPAFDHPFKNSGDRLHPLLDHLSVAGPYICISRELVEECRSDPRFKQPDASWRKMRLSSVPCHSVRIYQANAYYSVNNLDGITLGQLMDEAEEADRLQVPCKLHLALELHRRLLTQGSEV